MKKFSNHENMRLLISWYDFLSFKLKKNITELWFVSVWSNRFLCFFAHCILFSLCYSRDSPNTLEMWKRMKELKKFINVCHSQQFKRLQVLKYPCHWNWKLLNRSLMTLVSDCDRVKDVSWVEVLTTLYLTRI